MIMVLASIPCAAMSLSCSFSPPFPLLLSSPSFSPSLPLTAPLHPRQPELKCEEARKGLLAWKFYLQLFFLEFPWLTLGIKSALLPSLLSASLFLPHHYVSSSLSFFSSRPLSLSFPHPYTANLTKGSPHSLPQAMSYIYVNRMEGKEREGESRRL